MRLLGDGKSHGHLLGDIYEEVIEVPDYTDRVMRHMQTPIRKNEVSLFNIAVLGLMGSGKTEICKYVLYELQQHFGIPNVEVIFTDNLEFVLENIGTSGKDVSVVIIDDAASALSSRKGVSKDELFTEWFKLRHIFEDNGNTKTGKIFTLLNWQRMKSVYPSFRNPDLWLFSSAMADNNDTKEVQSRTGDIAYRELKVHWDRIQGGDSSEKSNAVVRFPYKEISKGVGWFRSQYMEEYDPSWESPRLIKLEEYLSSKSKMSDEEKLQKLLENPKTKKAAEVYQMCAIEEKRQKDVAIEYEMSQSAVSQIVTRVEEMMSKM